jgi:hypothetical protein
MMKCIDCRYWHAVPDDRATTIRGQCRAHPPVIQGPPHSIVSMWPLTADFDWCGEFAARLSGQQEMIGGGRPATPEEAAALAKWNARLTPQKVGDPAITATIL